MLGHPCGDRVPVGGVADEAEHVAAVLILRVIQDDVVEDATVVGEDEAVARAAHGKRLDAEGYEAVHERCGAGAVDADASHVGHVENADVAADGLGLRDDALVLHRHLPSGKGHHTSARGGMVVVEGGAQQGGSVRRQGVLQSRSISIV